MSADPVTVMKQLFAGYALGDDDGVMALVHPEGRWFFPGDPAILPWAGWWEGRDFRRFLDTVKDQLDFLEYTVRDFLPVDEERVVVRCLERCRCKATGKVCDNEHMGVATVRGGRVWRWIEYADTAAWHAAFAD
ncbi:MAG: nuclear transport factor 2 family protein [Alphaproteobacteria bacterium]|nr:nuclear transport factor 2 family protein [Alphaproteobacteria bacterium]